jgi:subtilisin family serine protease
MKHAVLLLIVLASFVPAKSRTPQVVENTIVVRFAPSSPDLQTWITNGRSGELPGLREMLGPHATRGFVSASTLKAVDVAHRRRSPDPLVQNTSSGIANIVVITTTQAIDPRMISRKLASRSDVVYAEPLPIQELIGTPNDPLATSQYYLAKVRASEAWDVLPDRPPVVVGIVDTGIDTTHPDLNANVWRNPGESGRDAQNRDRRSNGVDDDGNGFVDDWFGWDFVGADGASPDNSPLPGHPHGTHVGGTVAAVINNDMGVAGVGDKIKVLAVKVGRDDPNARSVERTSDGILYAAAVGATVINCSFGSSSASFADLDVINEARALGALVVAAAGNDGTDQGFYPAAHPPVLSVAATNEDDERAFFSNYHYTVDVAAPGQSILSTVAGGSYDYYDGTSMASPIVAAIAGMTKLMDPTLTPDQLRASVKANVDNIDTLNISFIGRLGSGRVNALASALRTQKKFAEMASYAIEDVDGDGLFTADDEIEITVTVANILAPLVNGRIRATPAPSNFQPIYTIADANLGPMVTDDTVAASKAITMRLPSDLPLNGDLAILISIYDGDTLIGRDLISTTVNPSYRTFSHNDVLLTVNSEGNIGYNDYPENAQGEGFRHRGYRSLLFEGGFLIGTSPTYLPNVVRGANSSYRDYSFEYIDVIRTGVDPATNLSGATAFFSDSNDRYNLGVSVRERVLQPTVDSLRSTTFVIYDITNISDSTITGLHAAMFMDWDLGEAGESDGCAWDRVHGMGIIQNTKNPSIPTIGVAMLSPLLQDFHAIDNAGDGFAPGIYDNFLRAEKWMMMSSGIARTNSRITDVSVMIGAGPFNLQSKATQQIVFAINAEDGYTVAMEQMDRARAAAINLGLNAAPYVPIAQTDRILYLEGGPAVSAGAHRIRFELSASTPVTIDVVDIMGRPTGILVDELNLTPGIHERSVNIPSVATGVYFLRMLTYFGVTMMPIQIAP